MKYWSILMMSERVDILLVQKGIFPTRTKAQDAIKAGIVYCDSKKIVKPSCQLPIESSFEIIGERMAYVSRGGYKLEKAITLFSINFKNKIVLDIGASTGGFSDCALQHGAKLVYALDVGSHQLDETLRNHQRVIVFENENFRYTKKELFKYGSIDIATIDVSFISLQHILLNLSNIINNFGYAIALIKPQFEAGKEFLNNRGIITSKETHQMVIKNVVNYANQNHFSVEQLSYSPIKGKDGNIEFISLLQLNGRKQINDDTILEVINEAHMML